MNQRKPSLIQVIRSVFAAFIGVQSDKNRQQDFQSDSILPFIIVGVLMALLFVGVLIILVRAVSWKESGMGVRPLLRARLD